MSHIETEWVPSPFIARAAKAVYGAVLSAAIAFLSALLPYITHGVLPTNPVAWIVASLAALVALAGVGGIVYQTRNTGGSITIRTVTGTDTSTGGE